MNLEYPNQCLFCLDTIDHGRELVKRETLESSADNFNELCSILLIQFPETPKLKRILQEKDGDECGKLVCWRCQQSIVELKKLQENLSRIQMKIKYKIWDVQEIIKKAEKTKGKMEDGPSSSVIVDFKEFGDTFRDLVSKVPTEERTKVELSEEGSALQQVYEALENESDELMFELLHTEISEIPEEKAELTQEESSDANELLSKLDIEFEEVSTENVDSQDNNLSFVIDTTPESAPSSPHLVIRSKTSVDCRYCNSRWPNPEKYLDHRILSHPEESEALAHCISTSTDKPLYFNVCPICHDSKPKVSLQHFMEHVLSHELTSIPVTAGVSKDVLPPENLKVFSCTFCRFKFRHKINLDLHQIYYHESSLFTLKCSDPQCSETFPSRNILISHITKSHSPTHLYPCKSCPLVFTSADQILSHMRAHAPSKALLCPLCRVVSPSLKFLYEHFSASHPSLLTPLKCTTCSEAFLMPATYNKHMTTAHPPPPQSTKQIIATTEESRAAFYSAGPRKCPHCTESMVFKNSTTLENHIRIYHDSTAAKHQCPQCPKEFVHKSTLRYHIQQVHLGIRYPCMFPSCDKSFTAKSLLKMHLKMHATTGGPAEISCNFCHRKFGSQSALKTHKITQHGPKEPADCDICGKHFLNKYSLRAHKSEVHNLKPYSCSICQIGFARVRVFEKHMRETHEMELSGELDMSCDDDLLPFQIVSVETYDN